MAVENFPIGNGSNNDGINTIPNGLPAALMRQSMENKNLLQSKGALYGGTGETNIVTTDTGNYQVAKTAAVTPPSTVETGADTYVLTYTGDQQVPPGQSDGVVSPTGLTWQMLSALGIKGKVGIITSTGGTSDVGTWGTTTTAPYTYTIDNEVSGNKGHGLGATSNIFVQLMMGNNSYEIVSSTINVNNDGTITIQSNIKWSGKILLFAIS